MSSTFPEMFEQARNYDALPYTGFPLSQTHPSRLAVLAALHGMKPASPARCRVLELGCGDAGNLLPMAYQFPESTFLGIDFSAPAIGQGRTRTGELGLDNLELRALDINDIAPDVGVFDYIIVHGVYSWVVPGTRNKILSICGRNLAPHGVAYVSYNCHPGSHLRDLSRAMMHFHVRNVDEPRQKIQQARKLLHTLAEVSDEETLHGWVLRSQQERVRKMDDAVLYHDDLDPVSTAFFLYQVIEDAARYGLQYLADATNGVVGLDNESPAVAKLIGQIPETDEVVRAQYLDFVKGRMFRETLLCHRELALRRPPVLDAIKDLQISADIREPAELDPAAPGVAVFTTRADQKISVDHRLAKAALLHLAHIWPQTTGFSELLSAAFARLGEAAQPMQARLDEEIHALLTILLRTFLAGMIEFDAYPARLTTRISDRPCVSPLARRQATDGRLVTNLRHGAVFLESPMTRRLVTLLDGTRSIEQLTLNLKEPFDEKLSSPVGSNAAAPDTTPPVTPETIDLGLRQLAKLALLVS